MTPATVRVSMPPKRAMPWSSWTTKSPGRTSKKVVRRVPAAKRCSRRRRAEQRALVDHGQLQVGGHEALAQGRREEVEARGGLAAAGQQLAAHDLGLQAAQPEGGALRLALVAEDDEDAVAVAHQAQQVTLGAGDVARRELRP